MTKTFCQTKDADHLSHWERYADNKKCVAIGLDANKVNEKIFCTDKEHIFSALHMNKMIYDEAEFIESAAMCIKNFYKISKSDFIFQPPAIVLGALYNSVIARKKNSSFCGENEIRINYR